MNLRGFLVRSRLSSSSWSSTLRTSICPMSRRCIWNLSPVTRMRMTVHNPWHRSSIKNYLASSETLEASATSSKKIRNSRWLSLMRPKVNRLLKLNLFCKICRIVLKLSSKMERMNKKNSLQRSCGTILSMDPWSSYPRKLPRMPTGRRSASMLNSSQRIISSKSITLIHGMTRCILRFMRETFIAKIKVFAIGAS